MQTNQRKSGKLWKNHLIKTDYAASTLLWIVSDSDACAQSEQKLVRERELHKRQECLDKPEKDL